jgi:hypothetical protein
MKKMCQTNNYLRCVLVVTISQERHKPGDATLVSIIIPIFGNFRSPIFPYVAEQFWYQLRHSNTSTKVMFSYNSNQRLSGGRLARIPATGIGVRNTVPLSPERTKSGQGQSLLMNVCFDGVWSSTWSFLIRGDFLCMDSTNENGMWNGADLIFALSSRLYSFLEINDWFFFSS